MKRFPRNFVVAACTRWGAWLLVLLLLANTGAFSLPSSAEHALPLLMFSYITVYALIWTRQLPHVITRTADGSVIILYDLVLSMLPIWPTGGWASPFFPFALSVLVVPTLGRGWRAGTLVAAIMLAFDQIILWTTPLNPWEVAFTDQPLTLMGHTLMVNGSLALLGRTLLPFGVVAATVGLVAARTRLRKRRAASVERALPAVRPEQPRVRSILDDPGEELARYTRDADAAPPIGRAWPKERTSHPAVERRAPTTIQAALRQARPELVAAGVALALETEGDEQQVPARAQSLVIKALEIALDNVIGHSHATSVTVALQLRPELVVLRVVDNGIGLFDGTAEPPGFHQLKRLRFRAQEIGGELTVDEPAEGGVRLALCIPLAGL